MKGREVPYHGYRPIQASTPYKIHYSSLHEKMPFMPSRKKIDLQKVLASLNTPCPGCGHLITPAEINRVTWDEIKCPKCGLVFDPQRKVGRSSV
jgi:predicted RNA-binding Zn-ribbon protein involved in translation (DUF1610 family)